MAAGTVGHGQSIPAHWPRLEAALGSGLALAVGVGGGRASRWWVYEGKVAEPAGQQLAATDFAAGFK